jgi:hypothetical protein
MAKKKTKRKLSRGTVGRRKRRAKKQIVKRATKSTSTGKGKFVDAVTGRTQEKDKISGLAGIRGKQTKKKKKYG